MPRTRRKDFRDAARRHVLQHFSFLETRPATKNSLFLFIDLRVGIEIHYNKFFASTIDSLFHVVFHFSVHLCTSNDTMDNCLNIFVVIPNLISTTITIVFHCAVLIKFPIVLYVFNVQKYFYEHVT